MRTLINYASKTLFILTVLLCVPQMMRAQSTTDLRINELLVYNDSNYVDGFGQHSPWIEIFNTAYNGVDIGGLFLTNDINNPTMYRIPKGHSLTGVPSRGYIVFFADNNSTNGVLHLNFDLRESSMVALFDGNGKTLIDSVHIRHGQQRDISQGRTINGTGEWTWFEKTTPFASNEPELLETAGDRFIKVDPIGTGMTFVAMGVVFLALILLSIVFIMIGKLMSGSFFKKSADAGKPVPANGNSTEMSGEIAAAIMMTLHLYRNDQKSDENAVLTINRTSKMYSPWSSKIHSMRRMPR